MKEGATFRSSFLAETHRSSKYSALGNNICCNSKKSSWLRRYNRCNMPDTSCAQKGERMFLFMLEGKKGDSPGLYLLAEHCAVLEVIWWTLWCWLIYAFQWHEQRLPDHRIVTSIPLSGIQTSCHRRWIQLKSKISGTTPRAEHALIRILKLLFAARQETRPTKRERELVNTHIGLQPVDSAGKSTI